MKTFAELKESHGLDEARAIVVHWLRDMADSIEGNQWDDVYEAELSKSEFANMTTLRVTTSHPWPG